ncbi:type IV pilin protein [Sphaerotilus sp.]|jgi:type IV pilus assembly protein PilE|uniref:type IV pilin protein n=1 Tax=Sphaerotilus sp. TaxID=2093942 RepID=UPI0025E7A5A4|nr:type IV pilin protein [Sphaerotilus sp.]
MSMTRTLRGFTLVELIIAVAVVGILAAVAMPSYQAHIASSRRSDAKSALLGAAQALERFYTERSTYAGATLGTTGIYPAASPQGYYTLSIDSQDANGFTLSATRAGAQVGDKCGNYTYDQAGTRGVAAATYTAAKCW